MKRIVSLVLALAMVLSLCIFTTASADDGFVDGKFTKTRHITVEVYNRYNDGGSDPTSSVYAQYIKQGMLDKYNVDVELVSVGRWTEVDDLNNLLATGDALAAVPAKEKRELGAFRLRDARVFLNSVRHQLDLVRSAGIHAGSEQTENDREIVLTIRIPKPDASRR